jgi:hypothetical protein
MNANYHNKYGICLAAEKNYDLAYEKTSDVKTAAIMLAHSNNE